MSDKLQNEDEWLAQLRQVYEADRVHQQAKEEHQAEETAEPTAEEFLKRCDAHRLMRQMQKTLLDGGGRLQFYTEVGGYDQAIVLMWEGPISDAAEPAGIDDVEASIIVSANGEGVFVNDERLTTISPDALRQRLLGLAQGFVADQPLGR